MGKKTKQNKRKHLAISGNKKQRRLQHRQKKQKCDDSSVDSASSAASSRRDVTNNEQAEEETHYEKQPKWKLKANSSKADDEEPSEKIEFVKVVEDLGNLPPIAHLLENPIEQWYKHYNLLETANETTSIEDEGARQSRIKEQRQKLGIKVSVRASPTSTDISKDVVFSVSQCPPPLPTNFFQLLEEKLENQGDVQLKKSKDESLLLSQLFYQLYKQSKGRIHQPTPVQLQSWPILLAGKCKNLLGIAQTGSGKTLAYGIGMVQLCVNAIVQDWKKNTKTFRVEDGPLGLVLAPTRELANQICQDIKKVAKCANLVLYDEQQKYKRRLSKITSAPKVNVMAIYGGDGCNRKEQLASFEIGEPMVHIVAATPGRLLDLIGNITNGNRSEKKGSSLSLKNVAYLVIDEADRMLQLGFREQISAISERIRSDRLSALFSATFPQRLSDACNEWLGASGNEGDQRPTVVVRASTVTLGENENEGQTKSVARSTAEVKVLKTSESKSLSLVIGKAVGCPSKDSNVTDESPNAPAESEDDATESGEISKNSRVTEVAAIPSHIAQILHVCAAHKKPKKLIGILRKLREAERERGRTRRQGLLIIFFAKIKTLSYMIKLLRMEGVKCSELHGQLKQTDREKTLDDFKCGKITTVLATDVAARGIHVNNIEYIVNYDFPTSIEQYVHRCGRAARDFGNRNKDLTLATGDQPAACVYSFFTRDLAPMAKDVLSLLKASRAWVDPNLVSLVNETNSDADQPRAHHEGKGTEVDGESDRKTSDDKADAESCDEMVDVDDGQFSFLMGNRIVLKRAEHVSDAEDSSSDTDE